MKIATGKPTEGAVVLEGANFERGAVALTPEEGAELLLAIAEADCGDTVSAEGVLAKLAHRRG